MDIFLDILLKPPQPLMGLFLWVVTALDVRLGNFHHLTLYSLKPQQSIRQWKPFANDNEAIAYKS